ncbi:MAG: site-specific integrase [Lachnospiraceae bacterium]|nr:site-specific integrase [Lachnospiraceae bacterium]
MASVSVQQKGNYWYTVISYKDSDGKWKNKMQTTGLTIKGNKKKAEKIAAERLAMFEEPMQLDDEEILLSDYLENHWLKYVEHTIERTTFDGYASAVRSVLVPYFKEHNTKLKSFTKKEAQKFYDDMAMSDKGRKGSPEPATIRRYHAVLHRALKHAVKMELIMFNPTDDVELPKKKQVIHNTFNEQELKSLNELLEQEDIGPLIKFESIYGTRRSEACGVKWKAIDFEHNELTINHTVVTVKGNKGKELIKKDRTKNSSSHRTFPITTEMRELFMRLKEQQKANRELFGRAYNNDDSEYVFVDALGNLIKPDYLTRKYSRLRDKYNLPHVTLHEIRHTVATLMLKHKVPMKHVQTWLGHSDFSTTANIYTHVYSDEAKDEMANVMTDILKSQDNGNEKGSINR